MNTHNYMYRDQLESERLTTRFLRQEDVETWRPFFNDKEAIELFPPLMLVAGENHALNWVSRQMQRYRENRYGLQALIDIRSGEFVGQCGLLKQEVDGVEELEVGYHVFKKNWGKGYAPEAAKLFIRYAFDNNLAASVISIIDVRNIKSQRVAEKNGLIKGKQIWWNGLNVFIYRIHNPGLLLPDVLQPAQLEQQHKVAIFNLWNNQYPKTLAFATGDDLDHYLTGLDKPLHYFVEDNHKTLIAWAFAFERDSETWFAIIVDSAFHKKGLGSHLLQLLKEKHQSLNGWVIDHNRAIKTNGEPYRSPLSFYLKNKFTAQADARLETNQLSAVKITWKK